MKKTLLMILLTVSIHRASGQSSIHSITKPTQKMSNKIRFKTVPVDGLNIFYREAGDKSKPAILLLHGFPSSSYMYRDLINDLSERYYVIAPDYPGFGQSSAPSIKEYAYSFDNLSVTIEHFIETLGLKKFSLYMQDYGGPVGLRIAAKKPEWIQSLLIQNANAYNEGLGDALQPLVAYIQNPNPETEKTVRFFLSLDATKWMYTDGAEDVSNISPDGQVVDQYYLGRKGNDEIQLALFRDYGTNLPKYEEWHQYFKKHQPKTLIVWGKNDKLFIAQGAEAYKKDLPKAELHLLNGGHFLLEESHMEVAGLIDEFLSKKK
jgi:pimeloyl-ACP methyl ester carboxylesterase